MSVKDTKNHLRKQRLRQTVREKVECGEITGPARLGYLNVERKPGTVVVDKEVTLLVQESFLMVINSKESLRKILSRMTERGLRSRKGNPLSISSFWDMLTCPFYAGFVVYQHRLYAGVHEPIVDMETYRAVQRKLIKRRRSGKQQEELFPIFKARSRKDQRKVLL